MNRIIAVGVILCVMCSACRKASNSSTADQPTGAAAGNPTIGGATQAVRGAVQRTAALSELKNLHLFIDNASGASGRMPTKQQIMEAAKEDPRLYEALERGLIVLTGATKRESIWAYVADAPTHGGYVVSATGVEQMDAAQLKQRLQSGN